MTEETDHNQEDTPRPHRLRSSQRALRLTIGTLLGVGLVVASYLVASELMAPQMRALARDMRPEDEHAAIAALEAEDIPFEIDSAGALRVPADQLHMARIALAVRRASDNRAVNGPSQRRALEADLARSIGQLRPVSDARVHVVASRPTPSEGHADPAASVVVVTRRGASLSGSQIRAIQHLVSGAVEGLAANEVSILDQTGRLLAAPRKTGRNPSEAFGSEVGFEQQTEARIVALLEPVVGRGKVRAQVAAELVPSCVAPEQPETATAPSKAEPGSADPKPATARQVSCQPSWAHPSVRRLTVAVVVDHAVKTSKWQGGDKTKHAARAPAEMASYRKLLESALGIDKERGDKLEIMNLRFAAPAPQAIEAESPAGEVPPESWLQPPEIYYVAAAVSFLLAVLLWSLWRSRRRRRADREAIEREILRLVPDAGEIRGRVEALRERVLHQARANVRTTASVLEHWLEPSDGGARR